MGLVYTHCYALNSSRQMKHQDHHCQIYAGLDLQLREDCLHRLPAHPPNGYEVAGQQFKMLSTVVLNTHMCKITHPPWILS